MGLFRRIVETISGPDPNEDEFRCINCGASFERNHHECPECRQPYVASIDEEEEE